MLLLIYTMNLLIVLLSITALIVNAEEKGDIIFFTIAGVANLISMINIALKII